MPVKWEDIVRAKHTIYALYDPRNDEPRYIGSSSKVEERFKTHLSKSHGKVRPWVAELKSLGLRPYLVILREVQGYASAKRVEDEYIHDLKQVYPLLNQTDHVASRIAGWRRREEISERQRISREKLRAKYAAMKGQKQILLTFNGRTMNQSQWAREIGITPEGLRQRLKRHPAEVALSMKKAS